MSTASRWSAVAAVALVGGACLWAVAAAGGSWAALWLRPDQQGERLMAAGAFAPAAERFRDPMRRGVALYRDGSFEAAAAEFARVASAEASFNRGNALVFLGSYAEAVASYDRALGRRPGWRAAEENRRIARLRGERLTGPEDRGPGTGGQLEPDEIVVDGKAEDGEAQDEIEVGVGSALTDAELQALWLRHVETRPADFLRAKFVHQLARQRGEATR